jgi:hypothetical protein
MDPVILDLMMERVVAFGHRNVTSRHRTTLEITSDDEISKRADCIVGVGADKGIKDLSEEFKSKARGRRATIELTLRVGDIEEKIIGKGHPDLSFTHETDMVIRKSEFICGRTLMIKADKSSRDLKAEIVGKLKKQGQKVEILINVK